MSIELESFKGALGNIVRPNRFLCLVFPPPALLTEEAEFLSFHIQSATLPDRTFSAIEMKYYGMTFKVAGNETLSELSITVLNDEDWIARTFFEKWANFVNDRSTARKEYMQDLYKDCEVYVQQLDGKGAVIAEYKFFHVYPNTVSEIEVNMETVDSAETFQVTFAYSYWEGRKIEKDSQ